MRKLTKNLTKTVRAWKVERQKARLQPQLIFQAHYKILKL